MKLAVRITKLNDRAYKAWCPVLPGCEATGETWERTLDAIQRAVDAYLASLDAPLPRDWDGQFSSEIVSSQS